MERCGKQREVLKHEPDAALLGRHEAIWSRDLLIVDEHAATGGALDAGGDPEQSGLAATRRSEQADDLARLDVEAHMIEREPLAEAARDILERQPRGESHRRLAAGGLAARGDASLGGDRARTCFQGLEHGADLRGSARPMQP